MWDKIKNNSFKILVFIINLGLVGGGAAYIKNQRDKQNEAKTQGANIGALEEAQQISTQAQKLNQIVEQNANQKADSVANNPVNITVQQPKTVTEVVPGGTTTVNTTTPTKTTKKS